MKKTLFSIVIILFCVFLCGCSIDFDEAKNYNTYLEKQNIIGSDYKLVDVMTHHYQVFSGGPGANDYYFIYKNDKNDIKAVTYAHESKENSEITVAYVYDNVKENSVKEKKCSSTSIKYNDDKCYDNMKYSFELTYSQTRVPDEINAQKYKVVKKGLIFTRYEFKKM